MHVAVRRTVSGDLANRYKRPKHMLSYTAPPDVHPCRSASMSCSEPQACKSNQEDTDADWGAVLDAMQLRREQLEEVAEARVALEQALMPIRTKKEVRRDLACLGRSNSTVVLMGSLRQRPTARQLGRPFGLSSAERREKSASVGSKGCEAVPAFPAQVLTKTLCSFAGEEPDAGIELAVLDCQTVRRISCVRVGATVHRTHHITDTPRMTLSVPVLVSMTLTLTR